MSESDKSFNSKFHDFFHFPRKFSMFFVCFVLELSSAASSYDSNGQKVLENKNIFCENFDSREVGQIWKVVKSCNMNELTVIKSDGFLIASPRDEDVEEMLFDKNEQIAFLPENTDKKFRNIVSYSAWTCSLKSISKIYFKNLVKLRRLALDMNKIETIDADTFEDLKSLQWLFLNNNKLATLKVEIFANLHRLIVLRLREN